jgi:hypothetical protein
VADLCIDFCRVDKNTGCVEFCYPSMDWDTVDSLGNCYGAPAQDFQERAASAGATVLAYGGDGTWFALKRRNDKLTL